MAKHKCRTSWMENISAWLSYKKKTLQRLEIQIQVHIILNLNFIQILMRYMHVYKIKANKSYIQLKLI